MAVSESVRLLTVRRAVGAGFGPLAIGDGVGVDGFAGRVEDVDGARVLRDCLRGWLEAEGLPDGRLRAVLLATHEAVVNSLQHAGVAEPVEVRAMFVDGELVVEIADRGVWRQQLVPPDEARGRGLQLIRGLVSEAEIVRDGVGTVVRLREPRSG